MAPQAHFLQIPLDETTGQVVRATSDLSSAALLGATRTLDDVQ